MAEEFESISRPDEEPPDQDGSSRHNIEEMWPLMPTDLQRKILDSISLQSIFYLRCVNRFFNNVMFSNEAWTSFGTTAMSPRPAFYFKSTSFPLSVD